MGRGATDFIGKPFEIVNAVVALLRRHMEARREADAAAVPGKPEEEFALSGQVGSQPTDAQCSSSLRKRAERGPMLHCGESGNGQAAGGAPFTISSGARASRFLRSTAKPASPIPVGIGTVWATCRGAFTGAGSRSPVSSEAAEGGHSSLRMNPVVHKLGLSRPAAPGSAERRGAASRF